MAQTALQELIENRQQELKRVIKEKGYSDTYRAGIVFKLEETIRIAKSLLPKERQIIEDAYVKGCSDTYGSDEPSTDPKYNDAAMASDYFTQNFNPIN
jgi:hypothetical protein